jgi:hypothetical protein
MEGYEHQNHSQQAYGLLNLTGGESMYFEQCGKELVPAEENEPYPWVNDDCYLYCFDCADIY